MDRIGRSTGGLAISVDGNVLSVGLWIRSRRPALSVKNRLRVLRAERAWSQSEVAERLSVSRQTVNAVENGRYDPSLPLAFSIARLFGCRIEEVFQPDAGETPAGRPA